ncbi:MAG: sulfite exporter TauE/SafE family protein [Flavobacteriales bacterium]
MEFADLYIPLLILAGFLAGFINTLAGNGSVFTLSLLLFLGLPVHVANGTNRLGAFSQSLVSLVLFKKNTAFKQLVKQEYWMLYPTVIGSLLGAYSSSFVSDNSFRWIIVVLMLVMLVLVLTKPKSWLKEQQEQLNRKTIPHIVLLFTIAFYAGFIQMGMGILYLSSFVLAFKFTVLQSNMLKILLTFFMIIPALLIFIYQDQVLWLYGICLAIGQGFGAWIATKFALENKKANLWVRYVLVIMIILSVIKLVWFNA